MKRLLTQLENDYLIQHFSDDGDRKIISNIFKLIQNLNESIQIFINKTYCILDGIIIIGK